MLQLGKHSYGTLNVHHGRSEVIEVGKYCSIGHAHVYVYGDHRNRASTFPFSELFGWSEAGQSACCKGVPSVGNDVWIADGVVILSGVTIGDGAILGGNSVVTKSVPPYAVVVGNPARIVKYRFPPEIIERLVAGKWWDLDEGVIRTKLIPHLDDITAFVAALEAVRAAEQAKA